MKVILLDRMQNLGKLGDEVVVKPGYGRNYLIPQGKAVLSNRANLAYFNERKSELEAAISKRMSADQQRAEKLNALKLTINAKVAEEGKLYGSVGAAEIVEAIKSQGVEATKSEVVLEDGPIRNIGDYAVTLSLHHGDILATVQVQVLPE